MSKYQPLSGWLAGQSASRIYATFSQIEGILSFGLPASARAYPQWWENDPKHVQAEAWLGAGFHTEHLNLAGESISFVRS